MAGHTVDTYKLVLNNSTINEIHHDQKIHQLSIIPALTIKVHDHTCSKFLTFTQPLQDPPTETAVDTFDT
jgi:hypothetical protein